MDGQDVKSPDQIIAEEEATQRAQKKKTRSTTDAADATEDEKKREWDEEQAQRELKRAARSAETCPESVVEKAPKGQAKVTLTFATDGHVKSSAVSAPYADTPMGTCVLRAMGAVIVPAFVGEEHKIEWEVKLAEPKKTSDTDVEKPKGKVKPKAKAEE
jgi:aminoglycoside/choline kinase family phosphotransferase